MTVTHQQWQEHVGPFDEALRQARTDLRRAEADLAVAQAVLAEQHSEFKRGDVVRTATIEETGTKESPRSHTRYYRIRGFSMTVTHNNSWSIEYVVDRLTKDGLNHRAAYRDERLASWVKLERLQPDGTPA